VTVRDELGDLAITLAQLDATPRPQFQRSPSATFASWSSFAERALLQIVSVGTSLERVGPPPTAEELEALAHHAAVVIELAGACGQAFEEPESASWPRLCLWRSALEFLTEWGLVERGDFQQTIDGMEEWGGALFKRPAVPSGMPRRHWWWFSEVEPETETITGR
jgi:hypothetical protein